MSVEVPDNRAGNQGFYTWDIHYPRYQFQISTSQPQISSPYNVVAKVILFVVVILARRWAYY